MKKLYIGMLLLFAGYTATSQVYNESVQSIISEISIDSLIYQLRNLSGEDSVIVSGEQTIIEHRVSSWGNDLAAEYIYESLENLGLEPFYQDYSSGGKNVLAVQAGTMYPDEYYMICAHYDAVDFYCADDNGSGTAGVLEAARVFSSRQFEYSIIYALWDQEEIGLVGSNYYASQAASNGDIIHAVINMDMISWDGDEDMTAEIHTSNLANSNQLSDYIAEINSLYNLELTTAIQLPGTTASDHSRFWNNGYAAVLLIEEYYGGDFNPYYHSEEDRIDILNMPYFHEMAKLAIGSLSSMANPVLETSATELYASYGTSISSYPNPFSGSTEISYSTAKDGEVKVILFNGQGLEIKIVDSGVKSSGDHTITLHAGDLPKGLYFLVLQTEERISTHKIVVQ